MARSQVRRAAEPDPPQSTCSPDAHHELACASRRCLCPMIGQQSETDMLGNSTASSTYLRCRYEAFLAARLPERLLAQKFARSTGRTRSTHSNRIVAALARTCHTAPRQGWGAEGVLLRGTGESTSLTHLLPARVHCGLGDRESAGASVRRCDDERGPVARLSSVKANKLDARHPGVRP